MRLANSLLVLSIISASTVSWGDAITQPYKIIDSKNVGINYAYGPSMINVDGTYYSYYCSSGSGSPTDWDHIRLSTSQDLINWSIPTEILTSTEVERANCDPSVVQFDAGDGPYYYLVYSGNAVNIQTLNFIARSQAPTGPFLKYTDRGTWENQPIDPHAIIWPTVRGYTDESKVYGAGQPSLVVHNGEVSQWYTDTTAIAGQPRVYLTTSKDMIHWTQAIPTNVYRTSVDVKFYGTIGKFVMFEILNEHQPNSSLIIQTSQDGIYWNEAITACDSFCFPDWSNNIGASGDQFGSIIGDQVLVAYGAPYNLNNSFNNDCSIAGSGNCWGNWDLFGQLISVNPLPKPLNSISLECNALVAGHRKENLNCQISYSGNFYSADWFVNDERIPRCHNKTSCSQKNVPSGKFNIYVKGYDSNGNTLSTSNVVANSF